MDAPQSQARGPLALLAPASMTRSPLESLPTHHRRSGPQLAVAGLRTILGGVKTTSSAAGKGPLVLGPGPQNRHSEVSFPLLAFPLFCFPGKGGRISEPSWTCHGLPGADGVGGTVLGGSVGGRGCLAPGAGWEGMGGSKAVPGAAAPLPAPLGNPFSHWLALPLLPPAHMFWGSVCRDAHVGPGSVHRGAHTGSGSARRGAHVGWGSVCRVHTRGGDQCVGCTRGVGIGA